MIGLKNIWAGDEIEEAFRIWCTKKETKRFRALPLNIAWGVWLAKEFEIVSRIKKPCL
jgi:hypothetical protein